MGTEKEQTYEQKLAKERAKEREKENRKLKRVKQRKSRRAAGRKKFEDAISKLPAKICEVHLEGLQVTKNVMVERILKDLIKVSCNAICDFISIP